MIEVLSSNIANQIAAGEVVQRPASIVKELMENAVDAGAQKVIVRSVDGGRTLLTVIDDGMGMSAQDAPRAFLRHATSKIHTAEDLFSLRTFGFRGEALASIASVAHVEMRTRRVADQIGTLIEISGGQIVLNDTIDTPKGTSIIVRNLFYNTPARRKFLKSDRAEAMAVHAEFLRVAMVNPDIEFELHNNLSDRPLVLGAGGLHQRIVELTKNSLKKKLLSIDLNTELVRLTGYIGTPDMATIKSGSSQFIFVNGRFVRSLFLARAVMRAYDRLIAHGSYPSYFLFIELSPSSIDVNISPTKTEVKFDDEQAIFQTIYSAVKGCLGRSNVIEAIDFDGGVSPIDIPSYPGPQDPSRGYAMPASHSARAYNPFTSYDTTKWEAESQEAIDAQRVPFMEILPDDLSTTLIDSSLIEATVPVVWSGFQLDDKFIVVRSAQGLSIINIARARCRMAYEKILHNSTSLVAQFLIEPRILNLNYAEREALLAAQESIEALGFVVVVDKKRVELHAAPSGLDDNVFDELLAALVDNSPHTIAERLADRLTRGVLNEKCGTVPDVAQFAAQLFACHEPSYTPSGLKVIETITREEIEKRIK
ncbi:MAG: DNA mismatch repair endonuclease MutL [Mucinivorans sp.]